MDVFRSLRTAWCTVHELNLRGSRRSGACSSSSRAVFSPHVPQSNRDPQITCFAVGFDCSQTGSDPAALRWRMTTQRVISVCSKLHVCFNIWISTTTAQLVPKLIHGIELQEHCCSRFPKGHWINHLSWKHCQWRSRLPASLTVMWQTGRSLHPSLLWGSGITDHLRAL